ncbi:MAG: hypothetical protein RLZZ15_1325, partial [Verrucomicrobiota bacterium]
VIDYSSAGYGGGGVALPDVAAKFFVAPSGGDDTRLVQGALDAVGKLPVGADGFRGAVLLRGGTFRIGGQLRLAASGVVLRGEGATLLATGNSRRTLIEIRGTTANRIVAAGVRVTDEVVAAGATTLALASVEGLAAGARVLVRRPSTREWIEAIKANEFSVAGQYRESRTDWTPGSRDIEWERTVVAVDGAAKTITLNAPITTALEAKFGGATVHTLEWPDRLHRVGVENLDCVSEVGAWNPLDEEHAWMCVSLDHVEDAWVRRVTARRFVSSCVWVASGARAVTVEDCASAEPVSEIGGWRRVSFYVGGQQVLVQRCTAEDGGRDFVVGHCAAGPSVFLDCTARRAHADSGPFESWANGALYDRVAIEGAALAFVNLGERTQGASWTAANCTLWNCAASGRIVVEHPLGAANRVVVDVQVPSLYRAQLAARAGERALAVVAATAQAEAKLERVPAIALDRAAVAFSPSALETTRVAASRKPVSLVGGYLVVEGRALFGGAMGSALWQGQLIPNRGRPAASVTRWAPGRDGPGLTENLAALTDTMVAARAPFFYEYPGLWYDRRRDSHLITMFADGEVWGPFFEAPWARSGRGRASDGLSKYDLTKFNPWYFARLREMADRCAERGLVLVHQAYDNHNLVEAAAHWAEFAWRPANNVNAVGLAEPPAWEGPNQNRHHIAAEFFDVTHPVRRELHARYINHILDTLGDAPNFVITVGYQFAGPRAFQEFFVDAVAAWGRAHDRRVRQQLQTSKAVTDAILAEPVRAALIDIIDTRYWQVLPDGKLFAPDGEGKLAFREIRNATFGREVPIGTTAEFVYRQTRDYRDRFPDKAVLTGHGGFGPIPVLMGGGASPVVSEGGGAGAPRGGRDDAALLKFVSERVADALPTMRPVDGLAADAWALADAARTAVLIYSAAGNAIALAQPIAATEAIWFNPRTGETRAGKLAAGAKFVAKPSAEAWLLLVR